MAFPNTYTLNVCIDLAGTCLPVARKKGKNSSTSKNLILLKYSYLENIKNERNPRRIQAPCLMSAGRAAASSESPLHEFVPGKKKSTRKAEKKKMRRVCSADYLFTDVKQQLCTKTDFGLIENALSNKTVKLSARPGK